MAEGPPPGLRNQTIVVPWDYSVPSDPETGTPNVPSPEGRRLGAEIARLADKAEASFSTAIPNAPKRCSDCAFRAGTKPNGCTPTLMDAIKCVAERNPFRCHKRNGEPLCMGWVHAVTDPEDARNDGP